MPPTEQDAATIAIQARVADYTRQLELARATDLARSKRYLEAEALLCPMGRLPDRGKELDLLARIAFQRRRHAEAERLWKAAIHADPVNAEYEQCLEKLRRQLETRKLRTMVAAIFVALAVLCAAGALLVPFLRFQKTGAAKARSSEIRP